jgi:hypothetical protein
MKELLESRRDTIGYPVVGLGPQKYLGCLIRIALLSTDTVAAEPESRRMIHTHSVGSCISLKRPSSVSHTLDYIVFERTARVVPGAAKSLRTRL